MPDGSAYLSGSESGPPNIYALDPKFNTSPIARQGCADVRSDCAQKLDHGPREGARATCEQLYAPEDAEKLTKLGTIYAEHGDLEDALKPCGALRSWPGNRRMAEL